MVVLNPAPSRVNFRLDSLSSGECRRQPPLPLMDMSEQALPLLVCFSKHCLVEQLLDIDQWLSQAISRVYKAGSHSEQSPWPDRDQSTGQMSKTEEKTKAKK